jgi:hypothetical protein
MTPDRYPALTRLIWYTVFDQSRSVKERRQHHRVIKNVLEIYRSNPRMAVIENFVSPGRYERVLDDVDKMLSTVKEERQLVAPIMVDGLVPGAFVCEYLKRRDMLHDVVFLGYTRNPTDEKYYKRERCM